MKRHQKQLLCVPNFSEGRDTLITQSLIQTTIDAGAEIKEASWDADHNRMVLAFEGGPAAIERTIVALAKSAIKLIDLRTHKGEHPRLGSMDVVPIIPQHGYPVERAIEISNRVGRKIGNLGIPVFLYEASAKPGRHSDLPTLRKGGFEAWIDKELVAERRPDYGPNRLHPSAGAITLGVRSPLIAFNFNLLSQDMETAQLIAKQIRSHYRSKGVRSLAFYLDSQKKVQISLNITQPEKVNIYEMYEYVREQSADLGIKIGESELIGVIRASDAVNALNAALKGNIKMEQVLFY